MRIEPLAAHQHLIPTIAEHLRQEWKDFAPWSDIAVIEARLRDASGSAPFPYCLVAVSAAGEFLGTASVKRNELPGHPDKPFWLSEVLVPKPLRGQGIGRRLIEQIVESARSSGIPSLFLYTPDQQELYRRLGWEDCCQEFVNGEVVTIMCRTLA
ncbi:MAG: GNAT family N-acetyltransferase [Planctomycetes bacterium]|nr:GNAT family N-acetyltransferase [Planctomycetota bacterium]